MVHRSIIKELLLSFLLSIIFLNFTLMMEKLLRLSRILSGVGTSAIDIAKIIFYLQPQILILTIPMAMLLSVLLTYGRMNTDNEMIILRGSGMSFRTISVPVVYLGIICFVLSLSMSFYLGPKGGTFLRTKVSEILTTRAPMTIEEGIFNTAFKDIVILVKEKPSPDSLSGIFIVDERKKEEHRIIVAKEGHIVPQHESLAFSLSNGHIYITKKDIFTDIAFGKYHFKLNPSVESAERKNSELTPLELLAASRQFPDRKTQFLLEFHRRLSMPAICLIIILLGPSLSLMAGKSGRLGGLTIGLSVFAIYYTFLLYGENLVRSGRLPHLVGAWMTFVILGLFSLLIFEKVNKK
ncbi:LptF/LptG family permease [Dissulfurispira thermophila]|uniref:LptF/LptG family permease n=1 Tax=Dissulfurispira thermophila TaxID=2715679 RepID=UPI00193D68F4|nr:LptF/LptG family permease [Dissulfurispira thermophila]